MKITNNLLTPTSKRVRDVKPGQVFSIEDGPYILLMTDAGKYVHLRDGSLVTITQLGADRTAKTYDHELVLKAVECA